MNKLKIFNKAKNNKNTIKRLTALLVSICMVASFPIANAYAHELGRVGEAYDRHSYEQELTEKGFPLFYAQALAELKLAHPTWSFEPLLVSEMEDDYTFDYIIKKETENPETNLVYPSAEYSAFFDSVSGPIYDSGWYSASDDAVKYFVDPRNFLNERDIFQFEDVSYRDRDYETGVDNVLKGTFMKELTLENGLSVRDNILSIGKRLSVSPIHIAARIRQEQGVGGESGMISGRCGELLAHFYKNKVYKTDDGILVNTPSYGYTDSELRNYNGYYNFFNVGASGNGVFYLYLNAMKRAKAGTPALADEWGGSPSWDSMYKSILGGAYSLKTTYVDDYQNTLYLQKFNVDPRSSRNFWGQYMQNVGAALSEGRKAYESYKEAGILESEFVFLIPVYSDMPESPCKDPSGGASKYSAGEALFTYYTHSDYPSLQNKYMRETRTSVTADISSKIRIQGYSVHTYGTAHYEISIDGGSFVNIGGYPRADVRDQYSEEYPRSYDINAYLCYIDASALGVGTHTAVIRAKTLEGSFCEVGHVEITVEGEEYDLDGDGNVSSSDIYLLIRYLSGHEVSFMSDPDINRDGKVNNRDVIALFNVISEKNHT